MQSEILSALASDLRVLLGSEWTVELDSFPVDDHVRLVEMAYSGIETIDRTIKRSVTTSAKKDAAHENAVLAVSLVRLFELCLQPRHLGKFVDGTFTSLRLFGSEFRSVFFIEPLDLQESCYNPFGDGNTVFQTVLFYACFGMYANRLTKQVLLKVLQRIRATLFSHSQFQKRQSSEYSILSPEEEDFCVDILDVFFIPTKAPVKEVKKQIVSLIGKAVNETDVEKGKAVLQKSSRITPLMLSSDSLGYFVVNYFSHGNYHFVSSEKASQVFLSIVALFDSYNVAAPGHLARTSWVDKVSLRIYKVFLIRSICMSDISPSITSVESNPKSTPLTLPLPKSVPEEMPASPILRPQDSPVSPPHFDSQFSSESKFSLPPRIDSPKRVPIVHVLNVDKKECVQKNVPTALPTSPSMGGGRLVSPPISVGSPRVVVKDNSNGVRFLESPLRPGSCSDGTSIEAKDLIIKSLMKSGMSPVRSERIAEQFVNGGQGNLEALKRVLAAASPKSVKST